MSYYQVKSKCEQLQDKRDSMLIAAWLHGAHLTLHESGQIEIYGDDDKPTKQVSLRVLVKDIACCIDGGIEKDVSRLESLETLLNTCAKIIRKRISELSK